MDSPSAPKAVLVLPNALQGLTDHQAADPLRAALGTRVRTAEQKRGLVEAVTRAVIEHTGASAEAVDVIIEDYPRTNWAKSGKLYADT